MLKVYIPDCLKPPLPIEEGILSGLAELICLGAGCVEDLKGRMTDADGILLYHEVSLTPEIIGELRQCKSIVRCGVGFDNVDIEAAGRKGIQVSNVPDYGVDEVADHAIGMMLCCNRGIMKAERRLRKTLAPWNAEAVEPVFRISGSTLGIIGCGRIGSATALRARALRMNVLVYDPYLRPGIDKALGVTQVSLEQLLQRSDVVSLHTPLTEETRHTINESTLGMMKKTAILVNTARGAVVDTEALARVLDAGGIAGAGIDVLATEPPNSDMGLIRLWQEERNPPVNLVITPHTAYFSESGFDEMRTKGAVELARVLRWEPPLNCVNTQFLNGSFRA